MTHYQQFQFQVSTALSETDHSFKFLLASNRDLFAIKKSNTGTNSTEVHILSAANSYNQFVLQTGTALHETDDTFEFLLAENRDLFAIKKSNTGTNSTEVHILSAASSYSQFVLQTGTALHETDDTFEFLLAANRDLFAIKKSNTGTNSTEVHILSATSIYSQFVLQTGTTQPETDETYEFLLASNRDLFVIQKSNTPSHSTEIIVLTATNNYQHQRLANGTLQRPTGTLLHETDENFEFQLASNLDLFVISKYNTASHFTEVYVLPEKFIPNTASFTEYNVKNFGAVGDGVTDDSPAFDAALSAMKNAGSSRGNKLIIPTGTFRLTHELFIECDCIIEGSGVGQENSGTILYFDPEGTNGFIGCHGVILNSGRGSTTGRNAGYTVIRDLSIQARKQDEGWLQTHNLLALINRNGFIARTRFKLENVNIFDFTGNGVHIVTGDGNNSDGNTIWQPGKYYTVGDWVKGSGFSRQLLSSGIPMTGLLELKFNPEDSYDTGNIFEVEIKCSIPWAHTPADGDLMIIPDTSIIAGPNKENVGAYILLVPQNGQYSPVTSTVFRATKYADDPYSASNGIKTNPLSVPPTPIHTSADIQIFTNLPNRYCCTKSGASSLLGEGPGEVRLRFYSRSVGNTGLKVMGLTSLAEATILSEVLDDGSANTGYLVITNSTRAFLNNEPLTFGPSATSGEFRLNWNGNAGQHDPGTTVTNAAAIATIISDDGNVLVITPPTGGSFDIGENLTFSAGAISSKSTSPQYVANGTQFHSIGVNIPDDVGATGIARWTQTTPATPHDMGNANNWLVEYCRVAGCGGHGMFIEGDNVNAGTSIAFDASGNGGWGIYDSSFLGNTHIGAHVEANTQGAYRTANGGNAHNVFIGCYSEGDYSPPSKIYNPSISLGGIMAAGFAADSSGFRLDGSSMTPHSVAIRQTEHEIMQLNYTAGAGLRTGIVTQTQGMVMVQATVVRYHENYILIKDPTGAFVDAMGLSFSDGGTAMASGTQFFPVMELSTIIGRSSVGAGIFSGINFVHSEDQVGVSLGNYNVAADSWEFGRINSGASFSFLGGKSRNGFQVGEIFVRGGTGAAGVGKGVGQSILCSNGYPLNFNQNRNGFYPGQLIINQNTEADHIAGWICKEKCGSGTPWSVKQFTDPGGWFITPSLGHCQFNNGLVYRRHESSKSLYMGEVETQTYPVNIGELTPAESTGIVWECFGYTDKGLEEILTREVNTTPDIPTAINITSGEDLDITRHAFQKFGLIRIVRGNIGVKFSIMRPIHSGVTYYVLCTVQTSDSKLTSVIANAQDDPDDSDKIIITIIGNSKATVNTDVAWLLKWS